MKPTIQLQDVRKSLGGRSILKGVSLAVQPGDIFGFLGPNGAGKTTSIRILLGLYGADIGTATLCGHPAGSDAARRATGFMLDGDGLYNTMTARQNLAYYRKLYALPKDDARIHSLLALVGLADRAHDRVGSFSKGMRQKLSLARALVHGPEVLVLDEPTSGLDPTAQLEFRQLMLDVAKKERKTVLFSSHNLDEVQRICNRIALLHGGEVKLYGELEALRKTMAQDTVTLRTASPLSPAALGALRAQPALGLQTAEDCHLIFAPGPGVSNADILAALAAASGQVEEITTNEASMEQLYASIVKEREPA